jgi:hypothetical protein
LLKAPITQEFVFTKLKRPCFWVAVELNTL